jgi:HEAT repeat protein
MSEHLLDHLVDKDFGLQEFVYLILNHLGRDVVDAIISRFVAVDNKFTRKALGTAIIRIGPPAVPSLIEVLKKDGKLQVVLSATAILGEIKSRDSVKALALTAYYPDTRLRLESINSLAKIGGREATAVLIELLRDNNLSVRQQVIAALGNSGNKHGLPPLIRLIRKRDLLGKMQELKKEALLAIGRIGDRQALVPLFRMVEKRYWIAPGRQEELKILAVEIISRLGGESSRVFLEKTASRRGRIGRSCSAALEKMAQRTADKNE